MTLGLIWAQSTNKIIGCGGQLPWNLPEDRAHFKAVTDGHAVIMGRRTWESLPERYRPLPGRRNIVLSRRSTLTLPGAEVAGSLADAMALAADAPAAACWVIGGAEVFEAAMPLSSVAEVTEIGADVEGDTPAPTLDGRWTLESAGDWLTSATDGLRYRFLRYRSG